MPGRHGMKKPSKTKRKPAPYPFILEALAPLEPEVRPMFSGFAVYADDKILVMLRDSPKHPKDNGVWLVFSEAANLDDPRLLREFPSLRLIDLLGGRIAHWRLIPADSPTFEAEALHVLRPSPQTRRAIRSRSAISADPSNQATPQLTIMIPTRKSIGSLTGRRCRMSRIVI